MGWRLALGFGLLMVLTLSALGLLSWQIRAMTQQTEQLATHDMQRLLRVQALSLYIEGSGNALLDLMNAPPEVRGSIYKSAQERKQRTDDLIAALALLMDDPVQEQTLLRLREHRAAFTSALLAMLNEMERNDAKAALRAFAGQVRPPLQRMLAESNALAQRERERLETQVANAQQGFEKWSLWVAVLSAAVALVALALAARTIRSVVGPMAQLEAAARRITAGDYTNPALEASTQEFARVGQALHTMAGTIAQREQEIERLAFRDPLTGLPNRTFLIQAMPQPEDPAAFQALIVFDLARLKSINETLGYSTGDALIKEVARRAQAVLHTDALSPEFASNPLLAHIEGGMFALYIEANGQAMVDQVRAQLADAMVQMVQCDGHRVDLHVFFGQAGAPPGQTLPMATMLRNAEVALNSARQSVTGFAWYSEAQEATRLSHLGLLSDLRMAAVVPQLQMWLQPKFSLRTGRAMGAEALVRWQHPQRGFITPNDFIPIAEQTGAVTLITDWMLGQAMRTLQRWQQSHPELSISVNVSTRDLQDPGFFQRVRSGLQERAINPDKLRLEIVESGLMQDAHASIVLMHRLTDLGVQLSIDDFGTGYSSLAYLQQLPVTELKIDRSFVTHIESRPGNRQLVRTMIEMGHGMGLLVTAEGVETTAERDCLRQLGCDVMQGYLTARPMFGAELQAWLDSLQKSPGA
ncbi:MAG: EAL domain-containing protein [Rhodoferax sp.]|jgi:diguanylate cyclase (GGDEF)-like protein|uniref:putative bifunctional diguanylate cyclase/phosphodiesterase n=1 Tax=Rhodoferax sp. TaxID=50421 RepID=UPI001B44888B|nr:EAL domain-containing protein [Rhodoferax sp.]MBP8286761.1 EAL domain-containing protein [Rhodoferax sp.]MBP9150328.1 EAL domain-containing protein [Rhodoferax sp.]MBP9734381.1 EAL domain-containing protein [Rhodoferax sp.]